MLGLHRIFFSLMWNVPQTAFSHNQPILWQCRGAVESEEQCLLGSRVKIYKVSWVTSSLLCCRWSRWRWLFRRLREESERHLPRYVSVRACVCARVCVRERRKSVCVLSVWLHNAQCSCRNRGLVRVVSLACYLNLKSTWRTIAECHQNALLDNISKLKPFISKILITWGLLERW